MLSEVLHFYYPYGHILFGLYCLFSLFICSMGVRYLYFRYKEDALFNAKLAKANQTKISGTQLKRSSLVDDLPFILSEEKTSPQMELTEEKSALV